MFGQTEINYVVGNCQAAWPVKPGSIGRPYPGHRVRGDRRQGATKCQAESWARSRSTARSTASPIRCSSSNTGRTRRRRARSSSATGAAPATRAHMDEDGYLWYQGRSDDVIKSSGYRIGPAEIESCLVKHPAVANAAVIGKPDATRGAIVKAFVVLQPGHSPGVSADRGNPEPCARPPRALRVSARDRVHRRVADDDHRQGAAQGTAQARTN